jgi:hypothetical protein
MTAEQAFNMYFILGGLTGLVTLVILLRDPVRTLIEPKVFYDDHAMVGVDIFFGFIGAILAAAVWPATWAFAFVYGLVMAIVFLARRQRQRAENPPEKPKHREKAKHTVATPDGAILDIIEEPTHLHQTR